MKVKFKGKVVGDIDGKRFATYRKEEHLFKKFQSFGISKPILGFLYSNGVEFIDFFYEGRQKNYKYSCKLNDFLESELRWKDKDDDEQKHFPIRKMEKVILSEKDSDLDQIIYKGSRKKQQGGMK